MHAAQPASQTERAKVDESEHSTSTFRYNRAVINLAELPRPPLSSYGNLEYARDRCNEIRGDSFLRTDVTFSSRGRARAYIIHFRRIQAPTLSIPVARIFDFRSNI